MGARGDDLALTGEKSQVESVLVSPALSPMSLVREILNPPRLQQSAWDLGTPLKWAADPGSRAMPDGVDLRQRTVGMRLSKASPEKTQVAKVEEILCFAGGTPRKAPHVSERVWRRCDPSQKAEERAEVEQPREEEEDAIRAYFWQLWGRDASTNKSPSVLVWIEKSLLRSRSFSAADCHPACDQDRHRLTVPTISISASEWRGERPNFSDLVEMADAQGRGRGRGRRDPNRNQRGGDGHLDQEDHGGSGQNQWAQQQFGPPQ